MLDLDQVAPRKFEFALDGEAHAIPTLDSLGADVVLGYLEGGGLERPQLVRLFRETMEAHAPGTLAKLTIRQLNALLEGWQATGDAGESSGSSD